MPEPQTPSLRLSGRGPQILINGIIYEHRKVFRRAIGRRQIYRAVSEISQNTEFLQQVARHRILSPRTLYLPTQASEYKENHATTGGPHTGATRLQHLPGTNNVSVHH